MRRVWGALLAGVVTAALVAGGAIGGPVAPAGAAGIVTHSWMAVSAVDHVESDALRALLRAHEDQVRAGAEFPDGGYATRSMGTPGGDYGEEAHWQRFVDAYTAEIRNDPTCGVLTDPNGPCAATVAHLMGVAAHGMGDEVWDWLFEPNGPGFDESYLPPEFAPFVGPGGLELQLDLVAIMRHDRPTGPTPDLPDAGKIDAAFAAVGRGDVSTDAFPLGEQALEIERLAEAYWAPIHIDALERAMPWTSTHMVSAAGGVDFGARAIAGYYGSIWGRLTGRPTRTRVAAVAPAPNQLTVPATGWTGNYGPGSNAGNSGGLTRIAVALSSALPYRAQAGGGSVPSELPADALRLRDLQTGKLVAARAGYPRIVPYNPEAGEHTVAFQPATDLAACRWYQAETTTALRDASGAPVVPARWRFRTSGCAPRFPARPVRGTVTCEANGGFAFPPGSASASGRVAGGALMQLTGCSGGQDGTPAAGAALPVVAGSAGLYVDLPGAPCRELTDPTGPVTVRGELAWRDPAGREIGRSTVASQTVDLRGGTVTIRTDSPVFPTQVVALRIAPRSPACDGATTPAVIPIAGGRVTTWSR
jgi:hypothetical protein